MTGSELQGTGVALVTPFDEKNAIDFPALEKLLSHTAQGVDYYVVMGTTGESVTTSHEEKEQVLEFVHDHNPRKLPIVLGVGGNHTAHVLEELARHSFKDVDAILSVSPYYNKPSQEGICQHFYALAEAAPRPVVLYNVPGRTASNIEAETTLRLAAHPNIIGIKEASGNIDQCVRIVRGAPEHFRLVSGDDLLTLPLLSIGGIGVISVLANAFPLVFRNMITFFREGKHREAAEQLHEIVDINGMMYEEGSPTGIKHLLQELGICRNFTRPPMAVASAALQKKIRSKLQKVQ